MDNAKLAEIEGLMEKATPGPWRADEWGVERPRCALRGPAINGRGPRPVAEFTDAYGLDRYGKETGQDVANLHLTAALRNAATDLIAAARLGMELRGLARAVVGYASEVDSSEQDALRALLDAHPEDR